LGAIDTASASRRATLTRLALTCVLGVPIGFVGLLYAGSGPVGMLFALPALYMVWVLGADALALARSSQGAEAYRARPAYKWFTAAGVLVAVMWVGFMVAQGGTIFGWTPHVRKPAASGD
jgi:hypothetical protein